MTTTALPLCLIVLIFLFNFVDHFGFALALKESTGGPKRIHFDEKKHFVIIPNPTLSTGPSLLVVYGMLPVTSATIFSTYGCEDFDDGSSLLRTGKISERPSNVMSAQSAIAIDVLCFAV